MKHGDTSDPYELRPNNRGVFKDKHAFGGVCGYTVVSSAGECLLRTQIKTELVTDEFEARLWRWLDAIDPVNALKVI